MDDRIHGTTHALTVDRLGELSEVCGNVGGIRSIVVTNAFVERH